MKMHVPGIEAVSFLARASGLAAAIFAAQIVSAQQSPAADCAQDPASTSCRDCLKTMQGLNSFVIQSTCFGTDEATGSAEEPVTQPQAKVSPQPEPGEAMGAAEGSLSCAFEDPCPTDLGTYRRCLDVVHAQMEKGELAKLGQARLNILDLDDDAFCAPDAMPKLSNDLDLIAKRFTNFTPESYERYKICLQTMQADSAAIFGHSTESDTEEQFAPPGLREYNNAVLRREEIDILLGDAGFFGAFEFFPQIKELHTSFERDVALCRRDQP